MNRIRKKIYILILIFILIISAAMFSSCNYVENVDGAPYYNTNNKDINSTIDNTTGSTGTNSPGGSETPGDISPTETSSVPAKTPSKSSSNKYTSPKKTSTPPTASSNVNLKKYALYVNRKENVVTVYKADSKGEYTIPVKAMICSTGRDNRTPTGTFKISDKYIWRQLVGNVYGQYACRFNGSILFHSVPYLKTDKGTLKAEEYNKLGQQASDGCVRLTVADAKWIYDNCSPDTKVVVYDTGYAEPLGKPGFSPIPVTSGWDPTDPDTNNPWKNIQLLTLKGVSDINAARNSNINLLNGVYSVDQNGKVVQSAISVSGNYNLSKVGVYYITYTLTQYSGGTTTASARLEIFDNTAPTVSGLAYTYNYKYKDIDEITFEKLTANALITDDGDILSNSRIKLTINDENYNPSLLLIGANTINYSVSDKYGNTSSGQIVIIIEN